MLGFAARAISSVLTVLYLITTIGACSAQPQPDESIYAPAEDIPLGQSSVPESLQILQSMPEISGELQLAVEGYRKSAPDSPQIHIQTVAGRSDYRAALRARLLAREPADLFHLFTAGDADDLAPYLEELSTPLPWISDGLVPPLSVGQKLYGLPYAMEGVGLIANRGIFAAAEIDLATLTDYESMSEAFAQLQEKIDAGDFRETYPQLEAVTAIAAQDAEYLGRYAAEVLLTGSFTSGAQAYYSPSAGMTDAAAAESLFKLLARYSPQRGDWPALARVPQNQMLESGIATQRVAVVLHSTEIYRRVYPVNTELEGQLALLPVYLEDMEGGAVYLGAPAYWAVNARSGEGVKEQAFDLLEWLYRDEAGTEILAGSFGACSPYRDTAADTGLVLHRQLTAYAQSGSTMPRVAEEAPGGWGEEGFAKELQEYYTTLDKEWDDVAVACSAQWSALRGE